MPYKLKTKVQADVLIAIATGLRNLETIVEITKDLKSLCEKHGVTKVLVDTRGLEGHLSTLEGFSLVTKHFKMLRDFRVIRQAAIVDQESSKERQQFIENVAVNRGYNIRFFGSFGEAREWLQ